MTWNSLAQNTGIYPDVCLFFCRTSHANLMDAMTFDTLLGQRFETVSDVVLVIKVEKAFRIEMRACQRP